MTGPYDVDAAALGREHLSVEIYGTQHVLDVNTAHALVDALQAALRAAAALTDD